MYHTRGTYYTRGAPITHNASVGLDECSAEAMIDVLVSSAIARYPDESFLSSVHFFSFFFLKPMLIRIGAMSPG